MGGLRERRRNQCRLLVICHSSSTWRKRIGNGHKLSLISADAMIPPRSLTRVNSANFGPSPLPNTTIPITCISQRETPQSLHPLPLSRPPNSCIPSQTTYPSPPGPPLISKLPHPFPSINPTKHYPSLILTTDFLHPSLFSPNLNPAGEKRPESWQSFGNYISSKAYTYRHGWGAGSGCFDWLVLCECT